MLSFHFTRAAHFKQNHSNTFNTLQAVRHIEQIGIQIAVLRQSMVQTGSCSAAAKQSRIKN